MHGSGKGVMEKSKQAVVLTPTRHEFTACKARLAGLDLQDWDIHCVMTGPGKANAAFHVASLQQHGLEPDVIIGAGTSGALQHGLRQGDIIASAEALVADWKMVDDTGEAHASYGELDYQPLGSARLDSMRIICRDDRIQALMDRLGQQDFKRGSMLTSDMFIAGEQNKLDHGKRFGCLACDMESGVFGFLANRYLQRPWFNIRVVADTIGETFEDYVTIEPRMTRILAEHMAVALQGLATEWDTHG